MMRRLWKLVHEMRLLRAWNGIRVSWGGLCSPGLMKGMSQIREPVMGSQTLSRGCRLAQDWRGPCSSVFISFNGKIRSKAYRGLLFIL